jgi:hypothetical protein
MLNTYTPGNRTNNSYAYQTTHDVYFQVVPSDNDWFDWNEFMEASQFSTFILIHRDKRELVVTPIHGHGWYTNNVLTNVCDSVEQCMSQIDSDYSNSLPADRSEIALRGE